MTSPVATFRAANRVVNAVAEVVMRAAFGHARHHRQDRRRTVQGLDLRLLVNAEH
jgi:hypothetical protein